MKPDSVTIILAEDDDGHATLVQTNLQRAGVLNPFIRVPDGLAALELLDQRGKPGSALSATSSMLLVLDIKMPRMDGIELLERLKQNPLYAKIPVIMLTTTDDPREIDRCYELGCNVYISKPVEYANFIEAIRRLGLLLQIVQVPASN